MIPFYLSKMCPFCQTLSPSMYELEEAQEIEVMTRGPKPILSNNNPSRVLVLKKELSGYPNYGNPSGNADILYTATQGSWNFNIPPLMALVLNNAQKVELVIRGALDDHYNVQENRYDLTVTFNGNWQSFKKLPFEHGRPSGQKFTNWNRLTLEFPPQAARILNRVTIRNTSNTGDNDWIALDWIELRFVL